MPTNRTRNKPKRSAAWKQAFLDSIAAGATVTDAAAAAKVSRSAAYDTRISDPAFANAWDEHQAQLLERVEQALYNQALRGDTTALIFLAKAKLKWSDKPQLDEQLRMQIEAMRRAISELDPKVQRHLLEAYERQLGAQRLLNP
jgi:hypothetical protein